MEDLLILIRQTFQDYIVVLGLLHSYNINYLVFV